MPIQQQNPEGLRSYGIIVTNYRRPQNIRRIAEQCLKSSRNPTVYIIDNSADGSAAEVEAALPQVVYLPQSRNMGAGFRFHLSKTLGHNFLSCIDDDLFLTSAQIDLLFAKLEEQPDRFHGIVGEEALWKDGVATLKVQKTPGREVIVLNRVYFYTNLYVDKVLRTAAGLDYTDWSSLGPIDDVLMSMCTEMRPLIHDIGPYEDCPTSIARNIAVWRTDGFFDIRNRLVARLIEEFCVGDGSDI